MDKIIVERVLSFIGNLQGEESMKNLRTNNYVEGYMACAKDIKELIEFAQAIGGQKKGA